MLPPATLLPEPARIVRELHPEVQPVVGPAPRVTGQALLRELKGMKDVAAGPSGLGKKHLLFLCEKVGAADIFADAFRAIFGSCSWTDARPLCEFRLRLIPKPNGKWRPIAIQETLLVAFHRLILKQTPSLRKLPPWQLAFSPLAQVKAIARAEALKRDCHLLTVDVKNAFNSVPHPVLLFSLHRARVPAATVSYVESFLRARHAPDLPAVPAGVPQGDPLSMAMFCHALTWLVESFLAQYEVLAYADDMILASSPSVPASTVREDAHAALARVGLSVTIEKCASTQDGGISFMGTRIIRDSPYNLAECATRSLYESLRTLRAADVSRHDKIRLLSYCIVPSVNYGPLVDAYPGPQSYHEVDALVVAELGALLGIPDKLARALALTPRTAHGVGLVLPHHYHADMQRQAQLADTAPRCRTTRSSSSGTALLAGTRRRGPWECAATASSRCSGATTLCARQSMRCTSPVTLRSWRLCSRRPASRGTPPSRWTSSSGAVVRTETRQVPATRATSCLSRASGTRPGPHPQAPLVREVRRPLSAERDPRKSDFYPFKSLTRALFQPSMASSSLRSAYLPVGPPCYLT
ncbi:Reverse transcriptase/endonuclease [Giardia duodenalis]|uniref:Reverse transcriptase/endonuclease n=1 Tax=Giardia intestinalis TaxID=5741 RepID=V6TR09_GIAIN|nr:Reverse transcriptase/endonuclease [Giardia intestinalis]